MNKCKHFEERESTFCTLINTAIPGTNCARYHEGKGNGKEPACYKGEDHGTTQVSMERS